ncbi:MAG: glycosyltransferase family 4 protein [Planctomycetota bacterium]
MRIAQVAPLYESVPPQLYGGTERVVSFLVEELVRQGHEVTLFASGDSRTSAELVPICPRSLRLDRGCVDSLAHHVVALEQVCRRATDFDMIHFHVDYLHFPWSRRDRLRQVTTLHGRLDIPDLVGVYREFPEMPVVSISQAQRAPLAEANFVGTVHHGLPLDLYECGQGRGGYLAFLGRCSPEKRVDRAIHIAERAGLPLKIAAKVDKADTEYFDEAIRPLLAKPHVEFLGEIGEGEKNAFLGEALGVLFPIDWPEPFGLVMIESFACGTPVIAYPHGSVPEVMVDGITGFLCSQEDQAALAAQHLGSLNRWACRSVFEQRFSVRRMAQDYVRIYERLARGEDGRVHSSRGEVLHPRDIAAS